MNCSICGWQFVPAHFNQCICSDACRIIARRQARARYKATQKGQEAEARWVKSERREVNERGYRNKERARKLAVLRSKRHLEKHKHARDAKRKCDRVFGKTARGRELNRRAKTRYRQTAKGKAVSAAAKAARRTALLDAGTFTADQWLAKLAEFGGRCAICGTDKHITVDHIAPISRGGANTIENLQPLCGPCNSRKGATV